MVETSLKSRQKAPENGNGSAERKRSKINKLNKSNELKNATSASKHRQCVRFIVILSVITIVYFYGKYRNQRETKFALVRETLQLRMQKFNCSPMYQTEIEAFPQCVPQKCGRFVIDKTIEVKEAEVLADLAKRILRKTGSSGGASVLDLHTGALSQGKDFVDVYKIPELVAEMQEEHLKMYNVVQHKIKKAIAEQFRIAEENLHLTYPTFFSRITNESAKTLHDEYWHEHVDKETYPSFHYTSLLYLSTFGKSFQGGRFIFVDGEGENRTTSFVEPKMGRVIAFTSGAENRHHVEKVTEGERMAITISFTCNETLSIRDPKIQ